MPEPISLPPRRGLPPAGHPAGALPMLQAGLLVVAVLYFGRELFIPIALAVLLAFVLAPVVRVIHGVGAPRAAAVLVAVTLACALIFGGAAVLGRQVSLLAENLPTYQSTIAQKFAGLQQAGGMMEKLAGLLHSLDRPRTPAPTVPVQREPEQRPIPVEIHNPDPTPFDLAARVAGPLLAPLATAGVVIILLIFILLYREDLRDRLIRLAGARDLHRTMAAMDDAAYRLSRYFLAQTGMNAGFGLFIAGGLWLIGIPNPLLWGVVAGVCRFIPFIGSYLAAAFPALLALAVDPGWSYLVWVIALFGISETIMGQVFEPWVFGHSTGLSPVAVIAAASFWTWLWGPVGLLLAVPLTVCLVVLGRHVDRLEFLEVALGDRPPLDPEEAFYQRALAGDTNALAEQAEKCLKEKPLAEYLDAVALPALQLAQDDAARGALDEPRLERFRRGINELVEDLEEEDAPDTPAVTAAWAAPGVVLCLPGRGALDSVATALAAQALGRRGFGVQQGGLAGGPGAPPRLVCLCLIEGGSSTASARYLLRRQRRRLPGVPAMVLVWNAVESSPLLTALRSEPEATRPLLATSLVEMLDQATDLAGTAPELAPVVVPRPEPPAPGLVPAPAV